MQADGQMEVTGAYRRLGKRIQNSALGQDDTKHKANYTFNDYINRSHINCRSQWPRGLRRRSAAARVLRSWVRIPPGEWMFVCCVVCFQVEVSATS